MNNVPMTNDDKDLRINVMIQQMAQQHQPELPSPGVIWWSTQIQKKFAEKERIKRPLLVIAHAPGDHCMSGPGCGADWSKLRSTGNKSLFFQNTTLTVLLLSAGAASLIFLGSRFS